MEKEPIQKKKLGKIKFWSLKVDKIKRCERPSKRSYYYICYYGDWRKGILRVAAKLCAMKSVKVVLKRSKTKDNFGGNEQIKK